MIRYNCDMCGRSLVPEEDERYVVKIEVYSACDSMDADCEDEEFITDFEDDDDESDEEIDNIDADEIESIDIKHFVMICVVNAILDIYRTLSRLTRLEEAVFLKIKSFWIFNSILILNEIKR